MKKQILFYILLVHIVQISAMEPPSTQDVATLSQGDLQQKIGNLHAQIRNLEYTIQQREERIKRETRQRARNSSNTDNIENLESIRQQHQQWKAEQTALLERLKKRLTILEDAVQ